MLLGHSSVSVHLDLCCFNISWSSNQVSVKETNNPEDLFYVFFPPSISQGSKRNLELPSLASLLLYYVSLNPARIFDPQCILKT